jgi:hypothetical protein
MPVTLSLRTPSLHFPPYRRSMRHDHWLVTGIKPLIHVIFLRAPLSDARCSPLHVCIGHSSPPDIVRHSNGPELRVLRTGRSPVAHSPSAVNLLISAITSHNLLHVYTSFLHHHTTSSFCRPHHTILAIQATDSATCLRWCTSCARMGPKSPSRGFIFKRAGETTAALKL